MTSTASLAFLGFVALVWAGLLLAGRRGASLWLLATSLAYFAWNSPGWVPLLVAETALTFGVTRAISREEGVTARRMWLALALVTLFGALFAMKYGGSFLQSFSLVSTLPATPGSAGSNAFGRLPLGVSFFTFQQAGYILDVYWRRVRTEDRWSSAGLFVAFFPQLAAGPIGRAKDLLPQFRDGGNRSWERLHSGALMVLWGVFKKAVIANRLAVLVDLTYAHPARYTGSTLLLATYFYAFQIYCDFSGYSNIAIGAARILGVDLRENFRLPYFATSISNFWSRWHISLSSWFRDYLFVPLGGLRYEGWRWYAVLLATFGVTGLWHGASLTFVAWGLLHGAYSVVGHATGGWRKRVRQAIGLPRRVRTLIQVVVTFHLVLLAWVPFRAGSLTTALAVLRGIASDPVGRLYLGPSAFSTVLSVTLVCGLLAVEFLLERGVVAFEDVDSRWPRAARWVAYAGLLFAVSVLGIGTDAFIYYQF